jgi:hypothetical protein
VATPPYADRITQNPSDGRATPTFMHDAAGFARGVSERGADSKPRPSGYDPRMDSRASSGQEKPESYEPPAIVSREPIREPVIASLIGS